MTIFDVLCIEFYHATIQLYFSQLLFIFKNMYLLPQNSILFTIFFYFIVNTVSYEESLFSTIIYHIQHVLECLYFE